MEAFALPISGSYHSPILLSQFPNHQFRHRKFKFEGFWIEDEEYDAIVHHVCLSPNQNRGDLTRRLDRVNEALKGWSRGKFSHAHRQIEALKRQ